MGGLQRKAAAQGLWLHPFDAALAAPFLDGFDWVLHPPGPRLALLVANGRDLWDHFLRAVRASHELAAQRDPLDRWIEATLSEMLTQQGVDAQVIFGHRHYQGRYLPLARIAHASGFCAVSPCQLAVRNDVGPWFALRALVLLEGEAPPITATSNEPCASCAAPCREPFERVVADRTPQSHFNVPAEWVDWLAVRDSCPVGRAARYSPRQAEYHYTHDRKLLLPLASE